MSFFASLKLKVPLKDYLFLSSPAPGQVLQYLKRQHGSVLTSTLSFVSDAVEHSLLRVLFFDETVANSDLNQLTDYGVTLSKVFPPRVTHLWRCSLLPSEETTWGYTVWEDGKVLEAAEHNLPAGPKPSLLSRLPGMKRRAALSPDIAWALARGLPIDRVPAAGLRRKIPIIDYDTVAQLDQRGLLVENSPRLYRFTL